MYTHPCHISPLFLEHRDPLVAEKQEAYMKDHFCFYGLSAPVRKELQRPYLLKSNLLPHAEAVIWIKEFWDLPQREWQYFAQELFQKYTKEFQEEDIVLLEYMVIRKSWWDTVDFVSTNLIGEYFKKYPKKIPSITKKWIKSKNIWLQRTALLFQLKYKKKTDVVLLEKYIIDLIDHKDFFIKKAIGWVLREYAKTDPVWVKEFVAKIELQALSEKEALKHL